MNFPQGTFPPLASSSFAASSNFSSACSTIRSSESIVPVPILFFVMKSSNHQHHATPMSPNTTKTEGQPKTLMRAGAIRRPDMVPTCMLPNTKVVALLLSFTGTFLAITSTAAGGLIPSPRPTAALDRYKAPRSPDKKGTANVATDHKKTPKGKTLSPPNLFASHPPGSCARRYP